MAKKILNITAEILLAGVVGAILSLFVQIPFKGFIQTLFYSILIMLFLGFGIYFILWWAKPKK